MVRIIPDIPNIKARWCHRCSEVPDWLEVPMSNGTVVQYYPRIEQPAFRKAMDNIRNMAVGYERKEPAAVAAANRPCAKDRIRDHSITEKRKP